MRHKSYDETYKRNAVSLVDSGTPAAQVARDLGIPAHLILYLAQPVWHQADDAWQCEGESG